MGDVVVVDLSGFATNSALGTLTQNLNTLQTNFNTLSEEFNTEKDKISTLQGEMTDVKPEVEKLEGITDKVTTYVVTKIGEEETARKATDEDFESRISTLETGQTTLNGKIDTEKGRIDALIGSDSGSIRDIVIDVLTETLVSDTANESFDTLQEVSAWLKEHPESAAAMNETINTNTTNITTNAEAISELRDYWE